MTEGPVMVTRDGAVARITLNRPTVGNAIDLKLARELNDAVTECANDRTVRAVLLTGNGRFFCTGGDVAAFVAAGERLPPLLEQIAQHVHAALAALLRMPKPLITAVNGPAAGAGIGLALAGDIALTSAKAHFTLAYTAIGMSPDAGATWLLPRLVGLRLAQELCLRNERVSAATAAKIGMVSQVIEPEALDAVATKIARELADGATSALGATRRLLMDGATASLETHLAAEARAIAGQACTADGRQGINAFISKRAPQFKGGN
ncbi:Enoyl-CoA hydratase/isomerase [Sphingobium chlorophenolicum L-1]|uniref:Enoyl-CoA hydratase/isomerase n=1 Tax=Sphingobium chlorophenolicum L-1 TaxID=690566 RepID=F6EW84_SPHCR|nr:enoyl-CoA hydratase-related protein [Sphingobium chlorophenolicum]AEG49778.1 Enoyl-CoA hydratase/isomerase [Sphingobium chlorophenolicum L-1]